MKEFNKHHSIDDDESMSDQDPLDEVYDNSDTVSEDPSLDAYLMYYLRPILERLSPVPWAFEDIHQYGFNFYRIHFETNTDEQFPEYPQAQRWSARTTFSQELENQFLEDIYEALCEDWEDGTWFASWNGEWIPTFAYWNYSENQKPTIIPTGYPYLDLVFLNDNPHRQSDFRVGHVYNVMNHLFGLTEQSYPLSPEQDSVHQLSYSTQTVDQLADQLVHLHC